jgi:hypothetical protein
MGAVTAALITGQEAVEYRQFDDMPPSAGCVTIDIRLCGFVGRTSRPTGAGTCIVLLSAATNG